MLNNNIVTISKMNLYHLDSIKNNLSEDFDDFWNYNILKSELENKNSTYFVLKINEEIIGFIGIFIVIDTADVTNIVIKKQHRGNHFSSMLLTHAINYCKTKNCIQLNLEVNSSNTIAIHLYEKNGFIQTGLRKKYYKNNDAILYTKYLK